MSKFYVSRQCYYYNGESTVEVTRGGSDYAGADMLVPKYNGEGKEYNDPREAVEAAISICQQWRKDGEPKASVATGSTGGMGFELEKTTFALARKWAKEAYAALPKCDHCGEPLESDDKYYYLPDFADDFKYCSENCANRAEEFFYKEMGELESEEEE
jgi:hypothetical protein